MATTKPLPELVLRSPDANWNRARWEELPEDGNRYEVIDGVLYMSTAPSSFHQWVVRQIVLALVEQVDRTGAGLTLFASIGVFMPGCDPVQPDVLVVRAGDLDMFRERRIFGVPALLVEVLSPANPELDTQIKRAAYARAGVLEYWNVRPSSRDVLVCARPDPSLGDYVQVRLFGAPDELVSPMLPVRTPVAGFFAGAPDPTP